MIGGHITRREGIIIAAFPRHQPRKIPNPDLGAALEHHMLKKMRHTRTPRRVFRPTCREKQILRHHRRPAEGDEGNLQPIGQPPMLRAKQRALRRWRGILSNGGARRAKRSSGGKGLAAGQTDHAPRDGIS